MFIVRNVDDLRFACFVLKAHQLGKAHFNDVQLLELKSTIRAYYKRQTQNNTLTIGDNTITYRTVYGDYDSYTHIYNFPCDWTREEIEEVYNDYIKLHWSPSPYDCTGQAFSSGHSIVRVSDHFVLIAYFGIDI